MAVKLTKNEQKKQKDALKQFQRYLPTLQLKKSQLQSVIRQIQNEIIEYKEKQKDLIASFNSWIDVFGEHTSFTPDKNLVNLIKIDQIVKKQGNIAGVKIPVFEELTFIDVPYSLFDYPLWVDQGIKVLKDCAKYDAIILTLEEQIRLVTHELKVTSQRVNLFEKVKIPQTKENIRVIGIYIGDQQTAAVVRGKISKNKIVKGAAS